MAWFLLLIGYGFCLYGLSATPKTSITQTRKSKLPFTSTITGLYHRLLGLLRLQEIESLARQCSLPEAWIPWLKPLQRLSSLGLLSLTGILPWLRIQLAQGGIQLTGGLLLQWLALGFAGSLIPLIGLQVYLINHQHQKASELKLFTEILFMTLKAGYSTQEALAAAGQTTDILYLAIQRCLSSYPADKHYALRELKAEVNLPTFDVFADLLMQASDTGSNSIAHFLADNIRLEEDLKQLTQTHNSKRLAIIGTVQLILPFLAAVVILFYPLAQQVQDIIGYLD